MAAPVQLRTARKFMNSHSVICAFCGKKFLRSIGRINEAQKFGWKQFCSPNCLSESKKTGKVLSCANPGCNKKFYRRYKQIKKVNRSFCSQSCAAVFNNKKRTAHLPANICKNPLCQKPIPRDRKYCSTSHRINPRKIPPEIYKEKIIARIVNFYNSKERIPVKREMYGMYRTARELFGSWNKAISAAGLRPNPVRFAEKQTANDGHLCDSLAEKIIDDWLRARKIKHERKVPYPEDKSLTVDFVVKDNWIEFFGLAGVINNYDKLIKKKRMLSKKYGLSLIEIYPKDLFPINKLTKILKL